MADNSPVNLDKAWLETFLNHDIETFRDEIKKIQGDGVSPGGEVIPALANLLPEGEHGSEVLAGAVLPVTIGAMAGDDGTNGKYLSTTITEIINAVIAVLEDQKLLFDDIDDNLRTSIEKLFKTQGDNLAKIDGDKFLDIFSDVDESLGGGNDEESE